MAVAAGKLACRVTVQTPTDTISNGEQTTTWTDVATVWAAVEPLSAREYWQAAQVQSQVTHRITLRWDSRWSLTAKHRIKYGSRVFNIAAPPLNVGERNEQWQCLATEQTT